MRKLISVLLLPVLVSVAAAAQQPSKIYRVAGVGVGPQSCEYPPPHLAKGTPWEGRPWHHLEIVLRLALRDVGLTDGQNLAFERVCFQSYSQLDGIATDLAARDLDAVLTWGVVATRKLKEALRTPIVFIGSGDPVAEGLVSSMIRPGGNVTGVSNQGYEVAAKRSQFLRELLPQARTVAYLYARADEATAFSADGIRASRDMGFESRRIPVDGWDDIQAAILGMRNNRPDVLSIGVSTALANHMEQLFRLATAEGLPTACNFTTVMEFGCLIGYAVSFDEQVRQAGRMLGRIVLGARPADMPVEQGTKFELWLNLKTADALGITIPPSLLARADRVIE